MTITEGSPLVLRWLEDRVDVEVGGRLCAGDGVLFGGWALAAAAEVAARYAGRPVRSVSLDFLEPVMIGQTLSLTIDVLSASARAAHLRVAGHVGPRPVLAALVFVAEDGEQVGRRWDSMPSVPRPAACPQRTYRFNIAGSISEILDVRLASPEPTPGDDNDGHVLLWGRLLVAGPTPAVVAVLADHVAYLVVRSIASIERASTVTASVHFTGRECTEWTLLDVRLRWTDDRYCVGGVTLWDQEGRILGLGEQLIRTAR